MRFLAVLALFGGAAVSGCDSDIVDLGKGDDDDDDDDDDDSTNIGDDDDAVGDDDDDSQGDADTDADTDSDTDTDTDTDSDLPVWDTDEPVVIGYEGSATVVPGVSWTGQETLYVSYWVGPVPASAVDLVPSNIGSEVCAYTWNSLSGTAHTASTCEDHDGNACLFAFDINATNVQQSGGIPGACSQIYSSPPTDSDFTLGMHENFMYQYGGYLYDIGGPWLVYYDAYGQWGPASNIVTWTPSSGQFTYNWIQQLGYLAP